MLVVFIFYLLSVLVLSHCKKCKAVRIPEQNMTQLRPDSFKNSFPAVMWRPNGETLYINGTPKLRSFQRNLKGQETPLLPWQVYWAGEGVAYYSICFDIKQSNVFEL